MFYHKITHMWSATDINKKTSLKSYFKSQMCVGSVANSICVAYPSLGVGYTSCRQFANVGLHN
jgi:hypothetical protein